MQPHKLIRYAAIILVLFYFSTSYGFLDTCPKRSSLTDKCHEQDDKQGRSERRVADVPREEVRFWREEPGANAENRRALDRNNNRITSQRERTLTFRRERNVEVPDQLIAGNDRGTRFRSFSTISLRSDRINTDRINAGNSIQKPILKRRIFDNVRRHNVEIERSFDKTEERQERRLSRINNNPEGRRSRQPNSNEFRQHEATKERNSVDVFREQFGIREAETRIQNSERANIRQDKNGVRHTRDVTNRQADRVLTERRSTESDRRRSSARAFDDGRRAFVRSAEVSSRFENKEQVPSARDGRQSSIQRESVLPDARRNAAPSRSRREERTSFSLNNRHLTTRREIIPSTFRREERSSYSRDNQQSTRRELSLPNTHRNAIYSRSARQQHGFRHELLAADIRQDIVPSSSRQEQREGRQLSTRRLAPSPVRRYSSSVFRREESRDDRLSSTRREFILSDSRRRAASSTPKQEERSVFTRDLRKTSSSDVRRDAASPAFRREERIISSTRNDRRERVLGGDAESSRIRQEEQSTFTRGNRQTSTRRLSPSDVRRDTDSSTVRQEERTSSTRLDRQSLRRQEPQREAVFSTFRKEERSSLARDVRRYAPDDNRRGVMFRREITRERRESAASRELTLPNDRRDITSSRFRQEKESIHENRRQHSNAFPTRQNRSASRNDKKSIRRELPDYYERRQPFISLTSGVDRKQFSIRDELSGNEGRIRNFPESKTNEQRSINRQVLKVDDTRGNERRQYPSRSVFLSNDDRRRIISPSRLHVNSRRLLDEEQYSRTSFSERSKSEIHKQIQLADKISLDWSNLAKTLLIALTLFQILAKTYPKKAGFQNLLHNSLGCVKQKVQ